jgi:hypothetical protein
MLDVVIVKVNHTSCHSREGKPAAEICIFSNRSKFSVFANGILVSSIMTEAL